MGRSLAVYSGFALILNSESSEESLFNVIAEEMGIPPITFVQEGYRRHLNLEEIPIWDYPNFDHIKDHNERWELQKKYYAAWKESPDGVLAASLKAQIDDAIQASGVVVAFYGSDEFRYPVLVWEASYHTAYWSPCDVADMTSDQKDEASKALLKVADILGITAYYKAQGMDIYDDLGMRAWASYY